MFRNLQFKILVSIFICLLTGSVQAQDWQILCNRVDSLREAGNYSLGIQVAEQALEVAKKTFGETHINYAGSLKQLGEIQAEQGDYILSELNTKASRDLYRKLSPNPDTNYINTTVTLAAIAQFRNKYSISEAYYQEALTLTEKLFGKESLNYVDILGDLGSSYLNTGDFTKAEPVLLNTLAIKSKLRGKYNTEYVTTLNSLGQLYGAKDDFARAESYLLESIQIREQLVRSKDHPYIVAPLNNLALVYDRQGSYYAALKLYNRAIDICERRDIKSHIYLAALNNAALSYTKIQAYDQADSLYKKLQSLLKQSTGADNVQYAVLIGNRGVLQRSLKHYGDAVQLLEQAYTLCVKEVSEVHPFSINLMGNLAQTYSYLDKEQDANVLFQKMKSLGDKALGMSSLDYANYLDKYSQFQIGANRIDSSFALTGKVVDIVKSNLTRNFLYQTARQQENILTKNAPFVRTSFDLAYRRPNHPAIAQLAYSSTLFLKNLLLSQQISLFTDGVRLGDNKLRLLADTLRLVSNQVAAQYAMPIDQRKNLDSLETRAETLEKELARQSAPFRQAQQSLQVRWQDVRDALKPTEAAVEFVSFPYYNGRQLTDSVRYLALVLRPGDAAPQVVPLLADEAPLRRLLARKTNLSGNSALYATRGSELDTDQLTRGDSLYQLVWQPIDSLLTKTKTVYVSSSGLLHQVAFAALPYSRSGSKKNGYLADRYQLRQVGSTRQIATPNTNDDSYQGIRSAKLYGGVFYDSTGAKQTKPWAFLPGTLQEVEQISQFMGSKATIDTGTAASEAAIKALSGQSPSVLHVATHGFAFPDPLFSKTDSSMGGTTFQRISNPLFRTGLLMAGSTYTWQGGRPALGAEDGILTAYEVANLNLANTRLVVLSACETALGDIRGSEGVFGLQRAFKMAGADYLLMSLWPVSDEATSNLMTQFYRNWKRYKTIRLAFQKTQLQMRQNYPPSVWAAFVLVE